MNLNQLPFSACLGIPVLIVGLASPALAQVPARPSAPSALAAAAGQDGSVTLTWRDNSSNESGFRITREPAFPDGDKTVSANETSFVDHPATSGQFRYRVASFNNTGRSRWTSVARTTLTAPSTNGSTAGGGGSVLDDYVPGSGTLVHGTPNIPSNLVATPDASGVTLTWTDNSNNERFFEIQKQVQSGQTFVDVGDLLVAWVNQTTLRDDTAFGTYRYRIRAGQSGGISAYTAWVTTTVSNPALPPAAPSGLTATDAGSGRALVSWVDNSNNETSFKLERNPAFATGIVTLNANVTSYLDQSGNGTFSYRVRTTNAAGTSQPTGWVPVTIASGSTGGGGGTGGGGTGGGGTGGGGTSGGPGWTDLTPPAGAQVFYVSNSSGSDSNPGTEAAPFKTISRGYAALRDGQPDQVLFKCGDTWNETPPMWRKASGSMSTYMVVGSYGTGPRPKWRAPQGESPINLGTQDKMGLAFVSLDLEPATRGGSNYAGVQCLGHWKHLLFEDLWIVGFPGNIVIQDIEQTHITMDDIKIRRNIIADSYDTGAGHSQGIFFRDCSNWVMEGNVLDNNARNKADIFCHNVYINEGCGAGIFNDNISARACSHGIQQRPGGTMDNNTFLANPINAYQGKSAYVPVSTNYFRYNVALDSRDINASNTRGIGFELGDADTIICEYNVAAHQKGSNGPYNIYALGMEPVNAGTIRGNVIYDWGYGNNTSSMGCNAIALAYYNGGSGSVLIENNKFYQKNCYGQVISHQTAYSARFTYRNNKYFSSSPASLPGCYSAFDVAPGSGGDFNFWLSRSGDTGSTWTDPGQIDATINAYMASLNTPGDLAAFMTEARKQSKQNWRAQFTSDAVNDWVRTKFGVAANP